MPPDFNEIAKTISVDEQIVALLTEALRSAYITGRASLITEMEERARRQNWYPISYFLTDIENKVESD